MIDNLTLRQMIRFEEAAQCTFSSLADLADPEKVRAIPARTLAALVWVIRDVPEGSFSWDDACALKASDLPAIIAAESTAGPFEPPTMSG
jgi:hypothetical protein